MENGKLKIGSIIRVDKDEGANRVGTHGWQVRFPTGVARKYHSKLFSDSVYGSNGKALVAAEEYYEAYLNIHEVDIKASLKPFFQTIPSHNKSGRIGVYRSHSYHKKGFKQEFWGAFCPQGPYGGRFTKRFYISTHGEEGARQLATEFREMWEEAVQQGPKALYNFFEEYHSGFLNWL